MTNHVKGGAPIVTQPNKAHNGKAIVNQPQPHVNNMVNKYENVIDQQPKKELPIKTGPLPHNQTNHVQHPQPVISNQQQHNNHQQGTKDPHKNMMRQDSRSHMMRQDPKPHMMRQDSRSNMRQDSPSSMKRQDSQPNDSKTEIVRMTTTGTSPDGPYYGKSDFEVDYPPVKQIPKQKTQIVYDLGSPEMNSQGINASIPITTDKYTYTITSVLSATSKHHSPPSSPTSSLGNRPISSSVVSKSNAKIGKHRCVVPAMQNYFFKYSISNSIYTKLFM